MITKLNRLIEIDAELDRLAAAVAGGTDVENNTQAIAALSAEAAAIMLEGREIVAPVGGVLNVPTSGPFVPLPDPALGAFPSERDLLRHAIFNSASAGVMYFSAAAVLWKVDAKRGREICVLLGINPDDRKPVRRF